MATQRILDFFPLPEARPSQVKSLDFVNKAVDKGYQDIIIQAPTGVGKSAILAAICSWSHTTTFPGEKGGYYLTAQKLLQKQLEGDKSRFLPGKNDLASIWSATNYRCVGFGADSEKTCAFGGRSKKICECIRSGTCPYKVDKGIFMSSAIAVTNYSYFFAERMYAGQLASRQVLVLDECHKTEKEIIRFVDFLVSEESLSRFAPTIGSKVPNIKNLDELVGWAEQIYLPAGNARLAALQEIVLATEQDKDANDLAELDQHLCKIRRAVADIRKNPDLWIFWSEQDKKGNTVLIAKPLHAAPFIDEMVNSAAHLRVYASAYPGPKQIFCKSLGLDPNSTAMIKLGSEFPPENRRVVVFGIGSMSRRNQNDTVPVVLKAIGKIMDKHLDRGLIHGHSYELCSKIESYILSTKHADRLIFPKNADERDEAMEIHASKEGSILLTPSMTEGFDFKDDLARWQIIPKVPYPSLGDPQTKAKADLDPEWYHCETVKTIVQSCGRICRSKDDHGITYILDDDFWMLHKSSKDMFPNWFLDAVSDARAK